MARFRGLHAVTMSLAPIICAASAPTMAAEVITRALPGVQSEATVASCGNRVVILSQSRGFLSVTRDGAIQPLTGVDHALFVFASGGMCLAITPAAIVDVSDSTPKTVREIRGIVPRRLTAAVQSSDGSIWFGVGGSPQVGSIDAAGRVRYFDLPEVADAVGKLESAELHLLPDSSSMVIAAREAQFLSASQHYIWGLRVSIPPNGQSYAFRFDPVTLSSRRLPLDWTGKFGGLTTLNDDLAVILTMDSRVLIADSAQVNQQWVLPGERRYVAPPDLLSLVTPVPGGADIVSLKDAALWHYSRERGVLELKARFPGRPSWITTIGDRLMAINTDAAELMTLPL